MIKLYSAPKTRSARAIWMLEEVGVDYAKEIVDIRSPERKDSAEFRRASPMGKVPALADGELAMSESAALCLYLADRYAPGRLAPALDGPSRGKFLYWIMYTPAVIEPAMAEKFSGAKPNRGRNGWGDFASMIETLEAGLDGREWIMGDQFTAADVMLGSSVVFMRLFDMMPESETLSAYADRCLARPAYQKAMRFDAD